MLRGVWVPDDEVLEAKPWKQYRNLAGVFSRNGRNVGMVVDDED